MLVKRIPLPIDGRAEAIAAADFTRKTNLRNYGDLIRVKLVSVCNLDNGGTRADVGYVKGGTNYYLDTIVMTNNEYFYTATLNILIPSDYQLIIKFVSPNAGDVFYYNWMCEEEVYED